MPAWLWKFSKSECTWNNYQIEEMQHMQVNLCSQLKRCEIWSNSTKANRITSDWYEGEHHRPWKDTFEKQWHIIPQLRLRNHWLQGRRWPRHLVQQGLHFLCLHCTNFVWAQRTSKSLLSPTQEKDRVERLRSVLLLSLCPGTKCRGFKRHFLYLLTFS